MIKAVELSKKFDRKQVLDQVGFQVKKGTIYGLLGSNGAGKTTIIRILAGILKQDKGSVLVDGKTVFENVALKQRIIFMPDILYFLPQYTVKQMGRYYADLYANWDQQRYDQLISQFKLENKKVSTFSKGMQRQVAFCLALAAKPDFLIMDEPLDGLDAVVRQRIKGLLINDVAEREMTVLISSHNLREMENLCDDVGIVHKGKMILERNLDDMKTEVQKVQFALRKGQDMSFLEELNILHQEKRGSIHLLIVKADHQELERILAAQNPVILDMLPLSLEEIFIYEMGGAGYAIENILD
ncbi:ABC transporter ATP-binding protein [Terribacillus saccharophilus]|uniref:ABC transporter n=1 Tax=Terribacillus saccharophilus TaxID=361277 RepID=A0ABX4GV58_9BACI|nr:ABC transporter ATP-binding protein [Terribacillus saccharophilus]PAD34416.1 ABC transporter [Terribacillus saccharophilus]PAD95290.1 ABC transporter [Terribacillus saccharophilus]PAD98743.1 ABC transporter [Terribacillus saccharophilus]